MCYSDTIESILFEAHAYGIRTEVIDAASSLLSTHQHAPAIAYELAFQQVLAANTEHDTH
jgi:hypothetical protein